MTTAVSTLTLADRKTWVYFIQATEGPSPRPVKIGQAANVEVRLRDHQVSSPWRLAVLRKVRGPVWLERNVHEEFAHLRLLGEWFRPEPELLEVIAERPDQDFLDARALKQLRPVEDWELRDHAAWMGLAA